MCGSLDIDLPHISGSQRAFIKNASFFKEYSYVGLGDLLSYCQS